MGGAAIASVALGQYTSVLGTGNQSDFGFGPAPGSARPILGIGVGSSRPAFRMGGGSARPAFGIGVGSARATRPGGG